MFYSTQWLCINTWRNRRQTISQTKLTNHIEIVDNLVATFYCYILYKIDLLFIDSKFGWGRHLQALYTVYIVQLLRFYLIEAILHCGFTLRLISRLHRTTSANKRTKNVLYMYFEVSSAIAAYKSGKRALISLANHCQQIYCRRF